MQFSIALIVLISLSLVNCVPTSVLAKSSLAGHNFKVKRSSEIENLSSEKSIQKPIKNISEIDLEIPLSSSLELGLKPLSKINTNHQNENNDEELFSFNEIKGKSPHKRGINSQLLYGTDNNNNNNNNNQKMDFYNPSISSVRGDGGIWADEIDAPIMYSTNLNSDLDDYFPRGQHRNKPYDNLQNILNSDAANNQESMAIPIQYYLGDRRKRSNKYDSDYDMRESSTRLTPADMLALVALVEAGERADYDYNKPSYYSQSDDHNKKLNSWRIPSENDNSEQMQDYYTGMPYNLENIPRYELFRDQKYPLNYYPATKRFMVSKKKRSLGHFYNEPISIPSISYAPQHQQQQQFKLKESKKSKKLF